MMDEQKEDVKVDENAPRKVFEIFLTKDGKVVVHSSLLNDKIVCYGLLDMAKDAVREYRKPNLVKGNGYIPNLRNFLGNK
jgi:hypothetical protein